MVTYLSCGEHLIALSATASNGITCIRMRCFHDDVIKWKHFPRNWPFVWGIHRSPVNSAHQGQWRGALMFSLIYVWINDWVNNREAGDLRRYRAHSDVIVMFQGLIVAAVFTTVTFTTKLFWWEFQCQGRRPVTYFWQKFTSRAVASRHNQ